MARPRKPSALLELSGAFRKHPDRRREGEPKPKLALGAPPKSLDPEERLMWLELKRLAPAKVLTYADRWLVEICCRLMAKVRAEGIGGRRGVSVGELSQLTIGLRQMGLTPADRSRITVAPDEEPNTFADLAKDLAEDQDQPFLGLKN